MAVQWYSLLCQEQLLAGLAIAGRFTLPQQNLRKSYSGRKSTMGLILDRLFYIPITTLHQTTAIFTKSTKKTGDIKWRFSTGESIANRPIVTDGRVYITTEQGGLYCISSTLGVRKEPRAAAKTNVRNSDNNQQLWQNKDIVRLLAVTPDRIFGMDKLDNIHILSTDTGRSLGRLQTEGISLPVVNHISDRIYLVTDTGLVQCLRDTRLSKPHYHSPQNNIGANNKQPGTDGESVEGPANLSKEGTENRNGGDGPFENSQDPGGENASEEESKSPFD